jgi:hypothetical protein
MPKPPSKKREKRPMTSQELIQRIDSLRVGIVELSGKLAELCWAIAARGVKHEPPPTDDIPF